jgi:hypothetical protein
MATILTIDSLAKSYASRLLPCGAPIYQRSIYDFKVTGFNLSTIATVMSVVLAIFTNSTLFLILAGLAYNVRRICMRELDSTGLLEGNLVDRLVPNARRADVARFLGVEDPKWQMVQFQLINFRCWMNWTPGPEGFVVVESH